MADRFPLIVNEASRKIEEMISGDNLDLTGNGIAVNGNTGVSGEYLKSTGAGITWGNPGDVYLDLAQTVTNKIFTSCTISGSTNTLSNIANASLKNSYITINSQNINLGGSVTTPDTNTTYSISAVDGDTADEFIVRLTAAGSGSGNDDVKFVAGQNVTLTRSTDSITIASSYVDTDTITRLKATTGGAFVSGDVEFTAGAFTTVSQTGNVITISGQDTDTITQVRAETGNAYLTGDITFLGGAEVTLAQAVDANTGAQTITVNSVDTITRLKGGTDLGATLVSGDINLLAGSNVTLTQSTNDITITSQNDNTVTKLASGTETLASGDFRFTQSGAVTLTQTTNAGVTTINIESANDDTGASLGGAGGIVLDGSNFELKNNANLTGNYLTKWDASTEQLVDSIISDTGANGTVTIHGSLEVTGTTTTVNSTQLSVADPIIELRRGANLTGANGGIQINRQTDTNGVVQSYIQLSWNEAGGYFRTFDGSLSRRLVTEDESQTLTNKTLTSPNLTTPNIGAATATSVNGLSITTTASGVLTITNAKTLAVQNSLTFSGTDGISIPFGNGPGGSSGVRVAYTSDSLGNFAETTSSEFRGIISDAVGTGSLIFNDNPIVKTGIRTDAATLSFSLVNTNAATINAFGAATAIVMGKLNDGTTTIQHGLEVKDSVELGTDGTDNLTINAQASFNNKDIFLFSDTAGPLRIGRGNDPAEPSNTVLGVSALSGLSVTGSQNTLMGFEVGQGINAGSENTGYGYQSLRTCFAGDDNAAFGHSTLRTIEDGNGNTAVGRDAMGSSTDADYNVCIGYFAGHAVQGNGNVLIGAAPAGDTTNPTYMPPNQNGDNQLVIGSGTQAWIRGDNTYKVTVPSDFTVGGDTTIQGNLEVQGTTTSINSSTIEIDDKNIELASAVYAQFEGQATSGSAQITNVNTVSGLIVGMNVGQIGSIPVPAGAYIIGIGTTAPFSVTINANFAASGTGVFEATGPTDLGADGGGLTIKGTTDKTITYDHSRVKKYFVISESLDLASGKEIAINDQLILDSTTLGSSVVNSSLTTVGTLSGLEVDDSTSGTGITKLKSKITEGCENSFSTSNSGALTATGWNIDCSGRNTVLYTATTSTFNQWEFSGVNLANGETYTLTLINDSNTAAIYVDACTVDGNVVTNGIFWAGGSPPPPSAEIDILTFLFVKDNGGTLKVFGQVNSNFS